MLNVFDPVEYSLQENEFLLQHLGKPPVVVMRETFPQGVNKYAVKPVVDRVYELLELEKHAGAEWAGVDKVKQSIQTYLAQAAKWSNDTRRGRQRFPSMHTYDQKGRPHRAGPGSDSGRVRSYFNDQGERVRFEIELIPTGGEDWVAPIKADLPQNGIRVDTTNKRIECSVCAHTESFNPESRGSYNMARARMSKHLRTTLEEVDLHREIHTMEFGS